MVLDMTRNSTVYEPLARSDDYLNRATFFVLASTLDGFLLTHRYLAHDVISARDCPAGKLHAHCAIAYNEHSCGYFSSSFMTACFISSCKYLDNCAEGFAR